MRRFYSALRSFGGLGQPSAARGGSIPLMLRVSWRENEPGALSFIEGRPACRSDPNRSGYFIASRAASSIALA